MIKSSIRLIFTVLLIGTAFPLIARAGKCDDIMEKVRENRMPETSQSTIKMTLIGRNGGKRVRRFNMKLKSIGEDTKIVIYFEAPPDIKGTAYLIIQKEGKSDKSYIYFPNLGKIKKVAANQDGQRFMGSDYTYGDFKIAKKGTYDCKMLGHEKLEGKKDTWIIENVRAPGATSQYIKVISWVDKSTYVVLKADFYDEKRGKIKSMKVQKVKLIEKVWTATHSTMTDLIDNHKTILELLRMKSGLDLPDSLFVPRNLDKV